MAQMTTKQYLANIQSGIEKEPASLKQWKSSSGDGIRLQQLRF